jgi:hypothetical protein
VRVRVLVVVVVNGGAPHRSEATVVHAVVAEKDRWKIATSVHPKTATDPPVHLVVVVVDNDIEQIQEEVDNNDRI